MGCCPWDRKESDTTERLSMHSCIFSTLQCPHRSHCRGTFTFNPPPQTLAGLPWRGRHCSKLLEDSSGKGRFLTQHVASK